VKIYNAGMRGGKVSVHEGGSRVPLFMRWPAAKWTPHVAKPIVSHIDLFPTLIDLCGVKAPKGPKLDGVSLRPLLEGTKTTGRSARCSRTIPSTKRTSIPVRCARSGIASCARSKGLRAAQGQGKRRQRQSLAALRHGDRSR
jgi:arylsulfatase A-like enzyme